MFEKQVNEALHLSIFQLTVGFVILYWRIILVVMVIVMLSVLALK